MKIWKELDLVMKFTVPLCGGTPRSDDVVRKWCELRAATPAAHEKLKEHPPGPAPRQPQSLEQVEKEHTETAPGVPDGTEEEMENIWVGFQRDQTGLFVRGGSLRAHLKDSAQVLGPFFKDGKIEDLPAMANFKSKFANVIYVAEDRLRLYDSSGKPYREPTGHRDATLSVITRQGPRTCLKRIDMCFPCTMQATIQFLGGGEITREHIIACFEVGKVRGSWQDRSLQFGRYDYSLGE